MNKKIFVRLAAIAATVLIAPNAHALLIGNTVAYDYRFPNIGTTFGVASNGNYVVGAGVEIGGLFNGPSGDNATINLSDTNILIDFVNDVGFTQSSFNGTHFSDVFGTIAAFTSVTINAATNVAGFDASRVIFDGDNIFLNLQNLTMNASSIISVDIGSTSTRVPEPGTLALLGLGALAAGALRRRRAS